MRFIILSLTAASFLTAGPSAISQDQKPQNSSEPTPKQLLHTEVGQMHIPVQAKPVTYANPYAGDSQAIAEGRKLFNSMNCSGCHGPQVGGGMGPPLSDD